MSGIAGNNSPSALLSSLVKVPPAHDIQNISNWIELISKPKNELG